MCVYIYKYINIYTYIFTLAMNASTPSIERSWQSTMVRCCSRRHDSVVPLSSTLSTCKTVQFQILALVLSQKSFKPCQGFPLSFGGGTRHPQPQFTVRTRG